MDPSPKPQAVRPPPKSTAPATPHTSTTSSTAFPPPRPQPTGLFGPDPKSWYDRVQPWLPFLPLVLGFFGECTRNRVGPNSVVQSDFLGKTFLWVAGLLALGILGALAWKLFRGTTAARHWSPEERRAWGVIGIASLGLCVLGLVSPHPDPLEAEPRTGWRWAIQRIERNSWLRLGPDHLQLLSIAASENGEQLTAVGAVATGDNLASNSVGIILRSTDAGRNWQPRLFTNASRLSDVAVGTNGYAVAVGSPGAILESNDGGDSWKVVSSFKEISAPAAESNAVIRQDRSGSLPGGTYRFPRQSAAYENPARIDFRCVSIGRDNLVVTLGTAGALGWKSTNGWIVGALDDPEVSTASRPKGDALPRWDLLDFAAVSVRPEGGIVGVGLPTRTNALPLFFAEKPKPNANFQSSAGAFTPPEFTTRIELQSTSLLRAYMRTNGAAVESGPFQWVLNVGGAIRSDGFIQETSKQPTNDRWPGVPVRLRRFADRHVIDSGTGSVSHHWFATAENETQSVKGAAEVSTNLYPSVSTNPPFRCVQIRPQYWIGAMGPRIYTMTDGINPGATAFVPPVLPYRSLPSPLFWLFGMTTIGGAFYARLKLAPERIRKRRIAQHAMSDGPVMTPAEDRLGTAILADSLSEFLLKPETETPFTIAVTGSWGTGKSSVLGMMRHRLEARGYPTVWFNAWHHQHDEQLFASLLQSVTQEGVPRMFSPSERNLWQRCLSSVRFWVRLWLGRMSAIAWVLLIGACILLIVFSLRRTPKPVVTEIAGTNQPVAARMHIRAASGATNVAELLERGVEVAWIAPPEKAGKESDKSDADPIERILSLATLVLRQFPSWSGTVLGLGTMLIAISRLVRQLRAFGFDPVEVFRQLRDGGSLPSLDSKTSLQLKFAPKFEEVTTAMGPDTKLVIFIDDLDRCLPDKVVQMLEAINFLVSQRRCHLVLGFDRAQVECAVGLGFDKLAQERALGRLPGMGGKPGELTKAQQEDLARQHRLEFSRLYLNKLINLEAEVPKGDELAMLTNAPQSPSKPETAGSPARANSSGAVAASLVLLPLLLMVLRVDAQSPQAPYEQRTQPESTNAPAFPRPGPERDTFDIRSLVAPQTRWQVDGYYWWMLSPLVIVAGFARSALKRERSEEGEDPVELRDALAIWLPWVDPLFGSPREKKRFLNLTRFFNLRAQNTKAPTTPSALRVEDIVYLAALEARPQPADGEKSHDEWQDRAAQHLNRFQRIPDASHAREFQRWCDSVRFGDGAIRRGSGVGRPGAE